MRIRRGLLFWGLFLIPLGALPLLVRAGTLAPETFADAWRLWPIVLIVLGAMIVLGRTRAAVLGTAVGALVLGTAAGGALASGNLWFGGITDCGFSGAPTDQVDGSGTFAQPAAVSLDLRCGEVNLSTGGGSDWSYRAAYRGLPPTVDVSGDRLSLRAPGGSTDRRQEWTVKVPAQLLREIDLTANAGAGTLDVAGASLTRVSADVNAGDLLIDAGSASIDRLTVSMNAGRIRLTLGESGSVSGSLSVNAGALDVCVPAGAELRIRANDQFTFAHNLSNRGLSRNGQLWTRAGTTGQVIDLIVDGNAASFTLNPEGGCR
jgi:hypothetical protein